ncbi:uncharacterized protein LOC117764957 isoform X2 [Hippoglossus hippoglossus]|uniref:uncharacterized protein LOC117764957 isoform X2 n=1 Tax=Hippoglossus hippoglossus TaxID=8267 RepID=UPI00148D4048|nr:uncharacterized protein LOC117764957 isoform X2 [Hippoglossus hippoglossus]
MFCFLIKEDPSEATGVSATSKTGTEQFVLLDEEQEGQPLPKRRRPGEKQKPGLSHCHHPHTSRKMRERNSPTIKEDSEVSSLVDYIHETTKHTVQRTLRTSPLYRKTQSSNGCQMFSSGRQAVLRHLRRRDMRVYSACSRRLHKVQAQQAAVGPTYSGTATMSLDDSSSEEENMESYFFAAQELRVL